MDRHIVIVIAMLLASPAAAQCRLCAPDAVDAAKARAVPLSVNVEAALDLGRAAQTRDGGGGTITIDPQTGVRKVSGTLADLGGFSFKGTVRLNGEPFAPVIVTMPGHVSLTAIDGSTAEVVDIRTDLRSGITLDAQGKLSFGFGGRLIVTAGQSGDFRGRIPVVAEYR